MATKKLQHVIVRTYSAGVFAGELVSRKGKEVTLENARRLWSWSGAASLSELAARGTPNPAGCRFPVAVSSIILTEAIEIISMSPDAVRSIASVPVWSK